MKVALGSPHFDFRVANSAQRRVDRRPSLWRSRPCRTPGSRRRAPAQAPAAAGPRSGGRRILLRPSIRNRTLIGGTLCSSRTASYALIRQNTWPLSSAAPRAKSWPFRTVGVNAGRNPFIHRVDRLDVVVAVDEERGERPEPRGWFPTLPDDRRPRAALPRTPAQSG